MVKSVCQERFKRKATASKFPAETGHKGTLAAKPVIKKVTKCHLLPCILYCSSITSTRKREHNSRLPRWRSGKESACQHRRCRRPWFDPWLGKIPWRRKWQPTPVFLPGESRGRGDWWTTVHGVTESRTWLSTKHTGIAVISVGFCEQTVDLPMGWAKSMWGEDGEKASFLGLFLVMALV